MESAIPIALLLILVGAALVVRQAVKTLGIVLKAVIGAGLVYGGSTWLVSIIS